jgi:hypothetical protein
LLGTVPRVNTYHTCNIKVGIVSSIPGKADFGTGECRKIISEGNWGYYQPPGAVFCTFLWSHLILQLSTRHLELDEVSLRLLQVPRKLKDTSDVRCEICSFLSRQFHGWGNFPEAPRRYIRYSTLPGSINTPQSQSNGLTQIYRPVGTEGRSRVEFCSVWLCRRTRARRKLLSTSSGP